jgi:hypothetical protein
LHGRDRPDRLRDDEIERARPADRPAVEAMEKFKGVGGTPGGVGDFIMGLVMSSWGGYMILERLTVHSHFYLPWFGASRDGFGPVFSIFLIGVFFLFLDGKSKLGWGFTLAGVALILWGVINSLHLYFQQTSMLHTAIMFGLLFGGLGLIVKSLRPYEEQRDPAA